MRIHGRTAPSPLALLLLIAIVLSGLAGFVMGRASVPSSLASPPTASAFPIALEPFDDSRDVVLALKSTPMPDLVTHSSGVMTRSSCRPGLDVEGGQNLFAVNGMGLITLYLAQPPYRDLVLGSSGQDVTVLQEALEAAGLPTEVTGYLDSSSLAAFNTLRQRAGLAAVSSIGMESYVWLPEPEVRIASCPVAEGGSVGSGTPLATLRPATSSLRIQSWPSDASPGARTLVASGTTVHLLRGQHDVTDPKIVDELLRFAVPNAHQETIVNATVALAHPLRAATIPASAVVGSVDRCVVSTDGSVVRVQILDSSLGRAVVEFETDAAPTRVELDPPDDAC
jgi:hypothetical protein